MWGCLYLEGCMIELYNISEYEVWFFMEILCFEFDDVVIELLRGFDYDLIFMNLCFVFYECFWLSDCF